MIKIATPLALAFTIFSASHAQTNRIKINVKETEIPVDIVNSFKKDFEGEKATAWNIMPAALVSEEYVVSVHENRHREKPTLYEVTIKGPNLKAKAVYDQNGLLNYSKETITDVVLPDEVRNTIAQKYPDFKLLKDQEIIKQGKSAILYYRVIIEKGRERIALAIDASGQIQKEMRQGMNGK